MDSLTELVIRQACADVITRYAMAVNDWDLDAFVAQFTEDAEWQRPGHPVLRGHAQIRGFMEGQPQPPAARTVRHVNGGILVDVHDRDTATAWSQTTVYDTGPTASLPATMQGPDMVVEYRDTLVRTVTGWRLSRRDTTVVFKAG